MNGMLQVFGRNLKVDSNNNGEERKHMYQTMNDNFFQK